MAIRAPVNRDRDLPVNFKLNALSAVDSGFTITNTDSARTVTRTRVRGRHWQPEAGQYYGMMTRTVAVTVAAASRRRYYRPGRAGESLGPGAGPPTRNLRLRL
jgi:hypothetical protein